MKSIKFSILAVATAIAISALSGCSGQTGATGATGPQGPQGAQGNANVVNTQVTVANGEWSYSGTSDQWYISTGVSALTSDISNGGAVEVFLSIDGGGSWNALPSTYVNTTSGNAFWTYAYTTGTVNIYFTWSDLQPHTDPNNTYSVTCMFNIVCIAPYALNANPGMNWKNYSEIAALPGVTSVKLNK